MGQPISPNQTSGTKTNAKSPYYTVGEDLKNAINPKGVGVFHPSNTPINHKRSTEKTIGNIPSSSVSKNVGGQEIKSFKNEGSAYIYDPESIRKLRQMDFTPDHIIKMLELSQNKNTNTVEDVLSLGEDNDTLVENKETKPFSRPFSHSRTLRENAIRIITGPKRIRTTLTEVPLSVVAETQPIAEQQKGRTVLRHAVINKPTTKTTSRVMEYAQKKTPTFINLQPKILEQVSVNVPEPVPELTEIPLGENIPKENKGAKTSPFLERTSTAFVSEQENPDNDHHTSNEATNQNPAPVLENPKELRPEVIPVVEKSQEKILSEQKAEKLKKAQEANIAASDILHKIMGWFKTGKVTGRNLAAALLFANASSFTFAQTPTQNTFPEGLQVKPTPSWYDSIPGLQDFRKDIFLKNNEGTVEQFVPSYKIDKNNPSLLEGLMQSSCYEVLHGETFKLEGTEDSESRRELGFFIKNLGMLLDATEVILGEKYDTNIKNYEDYLAKNPKITVGEFLDLVKNATVRANTQQRK